MQNDRFQTICMVLFSLFAVASCFGALYPRDLLLQHAPTVLFVLGWFGLRRRFRFSDRSFCCLLGFMTLHVIGARYIYTYVPYDDWARRLFGVGITDSFGLTRNHYDRLVHFCFGLLLACPAREVLLRSRLVSERSASYFAVEFIIAAAVVYELGEWLVAIIFAPDWADRYLGQQGDAWDAHKDIALAILGALLAMAGTAVVRRRRQNRLQAE